VWRRRPLLWDQTYHVLHAIACSIKATARRGVVKPISSDVAACKIDGTGLL
jgi:hypothetical protein